MELLERPSDLLVGVGVDTTRHDHTVRLTPGSAVLLLTDGLIERRGEHLDVKLARLRQAVAGLAGLPLQQLCDALVHRLAEGSEDDVALLAVRAHPEDRPRPIEASPERLPVDMTGTDPVLTGGTKPT